MRLMLLAAVVGCGFSPAMSTATPADGPLQHGADAPVAIDSSAIDTPVVAIDAPLPIDVAIDAPVDAGNPYCTAPDQTGMVLCLEFDEPGLTGSSVTALDGGSGHHDATITNADQITRSTPETSFAQQVWQDMDVTADIQTADSPDFGLQQFTLMAWVAPAQAQTPGYYYGVIEKDGQWLLDVDSNNDVGCVVEGDEVAAVGGSAIPADGTWSFVACTYDGSNLCTYANPTGSSTGTCTPSSLASLNTGPSHGVVVGGQWLDDPGAVRNHLDGQIDSARIFSRAMTAAELAAASAQ